MLKSTQSLFEWFLFEKEKADFVDFCISNIESVNKQFNKI